MKQLKVKITDTTLRDAQQSLWATRMRTEDMLPIAVHLDNAGYHSLEVWGGSTFDVCLRYLNECPWERLRALKKVVKNTPLQMLLRGQTLVGYHHYTNDVVEAFINKAVENGIDIIRIYDALNDLRNLETSVRSSKKAGAHVQAAIVYSISPVHTTHYYVEFAAKLADLGADSICIKDMAGLLTPHKAYELVKLLKENVGLPVQLHSHYIGGMALGSYVKAAEAGVDVLDTASVPLAFGASQPPVETVVRVLSDTPYDTGLDIHSLFDIAHYFEDLRKANNQERAVTRISDMRVFDHQVPGGMISNLVTQLEEQKALHRIDDVINEIPKVRADLGYPPLVTPISQIVGTQAVLNVLVGERYSLVPGEVKAYVKGQYGKPPAPMNDEVMQKILGHSTPEVCDLTDLLAQPKLDKIRAEVKDLVEAEEDILSYAIFPQVAKRFFENRGKPQVAEPTKRPVAKKQESLTPKLTLSASAPKDLEAALAERATSKEVVNKEVLDMNLNEIKELIKLIDQTDIAEVSLESDGVKVAIKKAAALGQAAVEQPVIQAKRPRITESRPAPAVTVEEPVKKLENAVETTGLTQITAPMVGTFYSAPAPDAPPFVKAGGVVSKGQILCIIEAMKLMNEIEAEVSGEIVQVLVENGEAVEYGQPLFLIREK